jgi:lipopolysaccharide export system protein LptC
MAHADPGATETAAADFDDDFVDLSFAGPEPVVPTAPWPVRYFDLASAYLPLVLMAVLAAGTWWLVRNSPVADAVREAVPPRHEPDYVMQGFVVERFAADGRLNMRIEGEELRHYPDDDTLEIDGAHIHAIAANGAVTQASARRALATGDGSEVQLLGDARVTRPATDTEAAIEFRGEFLHAFRNIEQVRSNRPVEVRQGASVVRAQGMNYDNLARVIDLSGQASATYLPPKRGSP